jgi:hypothetical protein
VGEKSFKYIYLYIFSPGLSCTVIKEWGNAALVKLDNIITMLDGPPLSDSTGSVKEFVTKSKTDYTNVK